MRRERGCARRPSRRNACWRQCGVPAAFRQQEPESAARSSTQRSVANDPIGLQNETSVSHVSRQAAAWPSRQWEALVLFGASLILASRLFLQVSHYAVNIFFSDQWVFDDATLFQRHSLWEMFRWQYGPQRQGVGALLSHI